MREDGEIGWCYGQKREAEGKMVLWAKEGKMGG